MPAPDTSFVDVLEAEQRDLLAQLRGLDEGDWSLATPAAGWDVRDQVSHLADTEEMAHDTVTGGPRSVMREAGRFSEPNGVIEAGVEAGRRMTTAEVLDWWERAASRNRSALRQADPGMRVPWGLGMSWTAFVTARLMEHWAHGLDIRAALGRPAPPTQRLQHIGWLGYNALPYAFRVAGVTPPADRSVRVEVTGPAGERWSYGPDDATDLVTGPAEIWCRRAVQRIRPDEAVQLRCDGPLAMMAVRYARAFL